MLQNTFILRRSGAAKFANIVKIVITFIKTTFKRLKKTKKTKELDLYLNPNFIFICWYNKIADLRWKIADISRTHRMCHVIYIFSGSSLGKVTVQSFIMCGVVSRLEMIAFKRYGRQKMSPKMKKRKRKMLLSNKFLK